VIDSIGPPESGRKIDKEAMGTLLEFGAFPLRQERDLDLFLLDRDSEKGRILVLDNEVAIYHTTIADVAMRKSPTIKEMISIRNAIKILNDGDVVVSKREESVKTIQTECIGLLDLSFKTSDLDEIEKDGVVSLESGYEEGVVEALTLFAEILAYDPPPKAFRISRHEMFGVLTKKESGELLYGPMVIYGIIHNQLKLIADPAGSFDKEKIEWIHAVAAGKEKPFLEGSPVFEYLKESVVRQNVWTLPT
jgi:hypothetical protein